MLRLMRDNFERGLYEGEEYQYWQKVSGLKEKLALLERIPEPAINRAARTLLDLRETWESTTKEERKDLVHIMIQEVGVDVADQTRPVGESPTGLRATLFYPGWDAPGCR